MNYQDKKKACAYCGKVFNFKRVSAKYCSKSCASMDVRRKSNPEAYRYYNPIHLEYSDEAYRALRIKAIELNFQEPKNYLEWLADEMITKNMFTLFLTEEEENVLKYVMTTYYPEFEFQEALSEWIKKRSEEEAIEIKKGKGRRN